MFIAVYRSLQINFNTHPKVIISKKNTRIQTTRIDTHTKRTFRQKKIKINVLDEVLNELDIMVRMCIHTYHACTQHTLATHT
jgi:hypothetical protein